MARKRDIVARVGADTTEFDQKLKESADRLDKFEKLGKQAGIAVGTAFVAAGTALAALTARGIQLGDALDKSSKALGVSVDALASLRYAAQFAGVESNVLEASLAKLAKISSEASDKGGKAAETLGQLGLKGQDLRALGLDEQLEVVADAMAGLKNETDKNRIAQELFGETGRKLIPLLNQGSAAIRAQRDEARSLGLTLDQVQQKNITDAQDALGKLGQATDGLSLQLAATFGPAIETAAGALTTLISSVTDTLPWLQALGERFFGIAAAAGDLSDAALGDTLVEQIKAMDALNNDIAEQRRLVNGLRHDAEDRANFEAVLNDLLDEQAEKQKRIDDLLKERVKRQKAMEEEQAKRDAAAATAGGGEDQSAMAAKAAADYETQLLGEVALERDRLRQVELDQEEEWRQVLFEAREEFAAQEIDAERALVDALLIEQQRYYEETQKRDAAELKRKKQVRRETVDNAFAGFTQITALLASHNEKAFKLNKVAAKAEASLNAFRSIQQVWADQSLPFYAKIVATALTAAATAANISSINSTEFGGGLVPSNGGATPVVPGGTGLGGQATGAGPLGGSQTIFVQGLSEDSLFSGSAVRGLLERLQEALKDGGKLVVQQ